LPVGIAFGLQRGQAMTSLGQFRFSRSGADHELGAALIVMVASSTRTIDFHRELTDAIPVLAKLYINGITAFRAFAVLAFELLHGFGAVLHVLGKRVQLGVEFGALVLDRAKLAGQDDSQL